MRNPGNVPLWEFTRAVVLMIGGPIDLANLEALAKTLNVLEIDVLRGFLTKPAAYSALVAAHQLGTPKDALRALFRAR